MRNIFFIENSEQRRNIEKNWGQRTREGKQKIFSFYKIIKTYLKNFSI